jgi:hypothetical protein
VPTKTAHTDSRELIAGLREQIPAEHTRFVAELLRRYDIPPVADGEIRYTEQRAVGADPSAVSQLLSRVSSVPRPTPSGSLRLAWTY